MVYFSNSDNANLYVPRNSKANYEATNGWNQFKAIKEYPDGDVNQDGETDVVDVVDIARFVVGTPSESFDVFLADLNSSKNVNVADAVVLVNEIVGNQNFSRATTPRSEDVNEALTLTLQDDNSLSLVLKNERQYTAFQFDLYMPAGTDVKQILLNAQRKQKHQLLYNKVEDGHYRVAALSTSNCTFNGNDGELLRFVVNGVADNGIAVRDIHFFTADGNDHNFSNIGLESVTGIKAIGDEQQTTAKPQYLYDLQGRCIGSKPVRKGIYIVNGKKVVMK